MKFTQLSDNSGVIQFLICQKISLNFTDKLDAIFPHIRRVVAITTPAVMGNNHHPRSTEFLYNSSCQCLAQESTVPAGDCSAWPHYQQIDG